MPAVTTLTSIYAIPTTEFEFYYYPPLVTSSMDRFSKIPVSRKERMKTLASNISYSVTHTFTYGAFAAAIYIFPKKTSSSSDGYKNAFDTDGLFKATCID